ncbi:hypothetical protein [Streptomyces sp. NPDC101455]|uniref:hypothetical protein n=1 Tax=Streptomyces sp. NPDC101455 TaxID=3366142 RepID=UPI0037F6CADB
MADDSAASASRNRLAKNPKPKPTRMAQLAQALLKDERRMGSWHRRNGARLTGAGALDEMWDALRALRDRVLGRTSGASGGASGGGSGGGQEAASGEGPGPDGGGQAQAQAQAPAFEVPYMSSSEMAAFERLGKLEETVRNLPVHEQEAFEDEILRLIGEDAKPNKWKTAYEKSPERMPAVTRYANNAYMRKLREGGLPHIAPETQRLRDIWERPAAPRETGFQDPSVDRLSDGNAFLAVRGQEELGSGPRPSAPRSPSPAATFDVSPLLSPAGLAVIHDQPRPDSPSRSFGAPDPTSPIRPPRPAPANDNVHRPSQGRR